MKTEIIIQCDQCKHQHKVHDKRIGESFSCFCGNLLTVPPINIHDAAVVRCSSCGGARGEEHEPFCRYCGSSFTLHERDLNTICPNCMTRISAKAKFCHSCATSIVADLSSYAKTQLKCPTCDDIQLHSRKVTSQEFSLKECDSCAGVWITVNVFSHLEQQAQKEAASGVFIQARQVLPKIQETINPTNFYRKCPQCDIIMQRKNYTGSSGIVIDVCHKHGIWFDIHELDNILNFIRSGLLLKHQKRAARIAKLKSKQKQSSPTMNTNFSHNTTYDTTSDGTLISEIIDWIVD